jgi:hypothetical protein
MGRPPKRMGERLSKNRTFRVRAGLDDQLVAAAERSGRSVSEEIEHRLEKSFEGESLREALRPTEALLSAVADRVGVDRAALSSFDIVRRRAQKSREIDEGLQREWKATPQKSEEAWKRLSKKYALKFMEWENELRQARVADHAARNVREARRQAKATEDRS